MVAPEMPCPPPPSPADPGRRAPRWLERRARQITLGYLAAAGAWIILSDPLLGYLVQDPELLLRIGAFKGLAFVGVTAACLFVLLRRTFGEAATLLEEGRRKDLELQELNRTLERQVERRTAELTQALRRAEHADRVKSTFLATMSHEFRTPLHAVLGFTDLLLRGLPGPINADQRRQLGRIREGATRLLDLINDILDISRIEAGQMDIRREAYDLCAVLEGAMAVVGPMMEGRPIRLETELPATWPRMSGDGRRLGQVVLNLLSNAVKFTREGVVSLRVEVPADEADPVRIHVRDTGIGIREEDVGRIFEPFRQVARNGDPGRGEGTGLGLAISRRLARLLGGDLTVESRFGTGSTFTVVVPRRVPEAA